MNIDTKKFNLELPCNLEPFGYIEETRNIITKNAGELMLIAYGALNHLGHYAPEFGGVALVCLNPDLIVAIKYIPWNAPGRLEELEYQFNYLLENHENMAPAEVTDHFYVDHDYILPAQKQRLKEEYFLRVAEENKARAAELKNQNERLLQLQEEAMAGKIAVKVNKSKPRTPEEVRAEEEERKKEGEKEEAPYQKPKLEIVNKKKKVKMVDGEELIPIDDDEEEE